MVPSATARLLQPLRLVSLSCLAAISLTLPMVAQAKPPESSAGVKQVQPIDPEDPSNLRPLNLDTSLLSLQGGQRLMREADNAVNQQDYALAIRKLQESRQVFNQLSNFHQELASSFSGIDNRLAENLRSQAVETAQMRDEATYQLALAHRYQGQPELSVPLLVQIIRSQNPTRELGTRAYQQLFELGFVKLPYPRPSDAANVQPPADTGMNLLSLSGGRRLMQEASDAVNRQDYALASRKLQESRQVFNQLSNAYQELAASFSGIDNPIADSLRSQAVETAQMRDEATYQLALVHRVQNQPELSVPLLVQIIRSQNPTRELGTKAYQQLFELGFVRLAYPRPRGQSTSSN
uniref:Uncharacterized protein n=1 Tax=Desertifilum tharense IPPAS B-1220 TaxID=1781255 RepID=A0ACD5GRX7_9CYAN